MACAQAVRSPKSSRREATHRGSTGQIVDLVLDDAARPAWVDPDWQLRVPVPGVPARLHTGECCVHGCFADGRRIPLVSRDGNQLQTAFPWNDWSDYIRLERYATWKRRPLHTFFPVSYHLIPSGTRHRLASWMYRGRDGQDDCFPSAPFDAGFETLRFLVEKFRQDTSLAQRPAPAVCLTHDVDTEDGFDWIPVIADLEESLGVRSCWNIVAHQYEINHAILGRLEERGFEIGLHDSLHDNKLVYLSEAATRRRLDRCRPFLERYQVRGFRSPSWLRNEMLYRILQDYVSYDSSCLDFDWLCPAGRGGALTCSPFRVGRLVEIPVTLPLEAPWLTAVGAAPLLEYWEPKLRWLKNIGGCAVVNTHPDPHYTGSAERVHAYGRFVEMLLEKYGNRWRLPRDLANEVHADA